MVFKLRQHSSVELKFTFFVAMGEILKVIRGLSSCQQGEGGTKDIRFRILRNTFIFSLVFILGWGPSGIIMFLTDFPPDRMPVAISSNFGFFKYFNIIGFVQNSLNPVLLFLFSSDLRQYMYRTKERFCRPAAATQQVL